MLKRMKTYLDVLNTGFDFLLNVDVRKEGAQLAHGVVFVQIFLAEFFGFDFIPAVLPRVVLLYGYSKNKDYHRYDKH